MNRLAITIGAVSLGLLAGCGHGVTQYTPLLRAQGELTLRYDDGFSMTAEGKEVAAGNTWDGLTNYVKCVPRARAHAESAESAGTSSKVLSILGGSIGMAGLGGLGGLAVYDKDPNLAGAILGIGVAAAITGVVLAAIGRNEKNVANGNAVDAMNYYNDEVGSYGGTCRKPAAKPPEVEPTTPAKPATTTPAENPTAPTRPAPDPRNPDEI